MGFIKKLFAPDIPKFVPPSLPPLPPPIPTEKAPKVSAARDRSRKLASLATGRGATILTGGLLSPASTTKKSLLGV